MAPWRFNLFFITTDILVLLTFLFLGWLTLLGRVGLVSSGHRSSIGASLSSSRIFVLILLVIVIASKLFLKLLFEFLFLKLGHA